MHIKVDSEFNIIEADSEYLEYVSDSKAGSFLSNVFSEDQHLLYETAEHLMNKPMEPLCFRMYVRDSEYAWVVAACTKKCDTDIRDFDIDIVLHDINELYEVEDKAERDYGTGLLTKKAITDYVLNKCENEKNKPFHLCIMDIDNFKKINDTMGHSYGDKVLKEVGAIVHEVLKGKGRAGRIGGDELMLVIDGTGDRNELRTYLKPIRERVEQLRMDKDGYPLITVSIGSGCFPIDADDYEKLFNLADKMLYRAKSRGKNRYVMYNPEVHGLIVDGEINVQFGMVHNSTPYDKTKLVIETIRGFFGDCNKTIAATLMQIVATYELDEGYIFYKNVSKSYLGYKSVYVTDDMNKQKVSQIVDSSSDFSYSLEPGFEKKFNANGVLVIDTPKNTLSDTKAPARFFETNKIQHAFLYKMNDSINEGYIVFYNTRDVSRKFPQSDITDFIYLCKMIEIAMKSR